MKMNHIPKINLHIWWSDNCTMLKLKSHKKVLKRLDIQNQDILNKSWVKNDQTNFKNYFVGFYPIFFYNYPGGKFLASNYCTLFIGPIKSSNQYLKFNVKNFYTIFIGSIPNSYTKYA